VLKSGLFCSEQSEGPLHSANVETGKEHGRIVRSNLKCFSRPSLLWSIDSDFNVTVRPA
jgi:hypothetical protein